MLAAIRSHGAIAAGSEGPTGRADAVEVTDLLAGSPDPPTGRDFGRPAPVQRTTGHRWGSRLAKDARCRGRGSHRTTSQALPTEPIAGASSASRPRPPPVCPCSAQPAYWGQTRSSESIDFPVVSVPILILHPHPLSLSRPFIARQHDVGGLVQEVRTHPRISRCR